MSRRKDWNEYCAEIYLQPRKIVLVLSAFEIEKQSLCKDAEANNMNFQSFRRDISTKFYNFCRYTKHRPSIAMNILFVYFDKIIQNDNLYVKSLCEEIRRQNGSIECSIDAFWNYRLPDRRYWFGWMRYSIALRFSDWAYTGTPSTNIVIKRNNLFIFQILN